MAGYVVTYDIQVNSISAINNINQFKQAVQNLTVVDKQIQQFASKANQSFKTISNATNKAFKLSFDTKGASTKLDSVIHQLTTIRRLSREIGLGVVGNGGVGGTSGGTNKGSKSPSSPPSPKQQIKARRSVARNHLWGPAYINPSTSPAASMAKGFGMAYGTSAVITGFNSLLQEAVDYNNMMQTAKNILETHDKRGGFDSRFADMERQIREVGVQTKFTAPQVADATKFLAMAGLDIEGINQSIGAIANTALIGDTDVGRTADLMTNIITGYNINTSQMGRVADVMSMTFTKTNTTLTEIAESFKYAASILSVAGVKFEESSAAIGILGDAGIKGSQAGTTMRAIVGNILKPTKIQKEAWDQIGIARTDKNGKIRPLTEIFAELKDKNLNAEYFYKMFHRTAVAGAAALTAHVDKWNDVIVENFLSHGLAEKLADAKKNTVEGLWYQLTSSVTEEGMKVFEKNENKITSILKNVTSYVQSGEIQGFMSSITKMVFELGSQITWLIDKGGKIVSYFGPTLTLFLKLKLITTTLIAPFGIFKTQLESIGKYFATYMPKISAMKIGRKIHGMSWGMKQLTLNTWRLKNGLMALGNAAISALPTLGATALIAGIAALIQYRVKLYKARKEYARFLELTHQLPTAKIITHSEAMSKYYEIANNKQLSQNDKQREYLKLLDDRIRKENILKNGVKEGLKGTVYQESLEKYSATKPTAIWGALAPLNEINNRYKDGRFAHQYYTIPTRNLKSLKDSMGKWYISSYGSNNDVDKSDAFWNDIVAGQTFLQDAGRDTREGGVVDKQYRKLEQEILGAKDKNDLSIIVNKINNIQKQYPINKNNKWITLTALKDNMVSEADMLESSAFISTLAETIPTLFAPNTPGRATIDAMEALMNGVSLDKDGKKIISNKAFGEFFALTQNPLMNSEVLSKEGLLKNFGYDSKTQSFNAFEIDGVSKTSNDGARLFQGLIKDVSSTISGLGNADFKAALTSHPLFKILQGVKMPNIEGSPTTDVNTTDLLNSLNGDDPQSGYKSNYKSSATPKQVLIKIENLMNVESIDMSKEDNRSAINTFKEQLTQVLLDVVSDTTAIHLA